MIRYSYQTIDYVIWRCQQSYINVLFVIANPTIFHDILSVLYSKICIPQHTRFIRQKDSIELRFPNRSTIRIVCDDFKCRGSRADLLIVDDNVDKSVLNTRFMPMETSKSIIEDELYESSRNKT